MPAEERAFERRNLALALILLAVLAPLSTQQVAQDSAGIDYFQFWLVGQAQERGEIEDVYSPAGRGALLEVGRALAAEQPDSQRLEAALAFRASIETFSTPLLYLFVDAFATGDYDADLRNFHRLCFASFALGVLLMCRIAALSWATSLCVLLVLLVGSTALASDWRVGNVNSIQVAGVAIYAWLLRRASPLARDGLGGAFAGLLTLFKPTLGLGFGFLVLAWVMRRETSVLVRQCAGFALAAALAVAASSLFLGSAFAWLDWLEALPALERDADVSVAMGNYSLARLVAEQGGPPLSALLLLGFVLLTGLALWRERSAGAERDALLFCLGCAVSVVALRLAWLHYYLLLAPLAILLTARAASAASAAPLAIGAVLALGAPLAAWLPTTDPQTDAIRYLLGAFLLVGLAYRSFWTRESRSAQ